MIESKITKEENILAIESISKLMVKYCLPAVLAMIIIGIQGMIDGMFVGNFIGPNALASVNIAMPFMQIIIGVSMVISIGSQSYVGINLGSGNIVKAQNSFVTFGIIISTIAILITIFGFTFNRQIAAALGADDVLISDVSTYIKYISIFSLPMCIMFYFGFLSRIVGKPERYLYGSIISVVVNVTLDYLFIARFGMGIVGAALATGIAYSSALLFVLSPMLSRKNVINIFTGRFSTKSIAAVLYNGSSEGINSFSIAVTAFLFNVSLMSIAGPGGVTAFTAINYVGTLGGMLLFGISDGIGPIVSYNFGMRDYQRVRKIMRTSYLCNLVFGMLLFTLLFFFGEQLVTLFIKDSPELVSLAVSGGKIYAFSFLLSGFNILNSGYFTFIGRGLESVLVAASRGFVFVSIGITALPLFLGINGIWLSVPFAEFCAVIVGFILLRVTGKRLYRSSSVSEYEKSALTSEALPQAVISSPTGHRTITISRQFGSGGREVGKRVADALSCAYYDKEILNAISEETGLDTVLIDELDSNASRNFGYTFSRSFKVYGQLPIGEVTLAKSNIMKRLAGRQTAVFIGRCSDYILSEHHPFKVYIYSSDMDYRVKRCFSKVPGDKAVIAAKEMVSEITAIDKNRAKYYEGHTGLKWTAIENYNLCIDTSKVGIKGAVDIILKALDEMI